MNDKILRLQGRNFEFPLRDKCPNCWSSQSCTYSLSPAGSISCAFLESRMPSKEGCRINSILEFWIESSLWFLVLFSEGKTKIWQKEFHIFFPVFKSSALYLEVWRFPGFICLHFPKKTFGKFQTIIPECKGGFLLINNMLRCKEGAFIWQYFHFFLP